MTSASTTSAIRDASKAVGARAADPAWLAALRADAALAADSLAFPDSNRERPWKYLDVSGLQIASYAPAAGEVALPEARTGLTVMTFATATGAAADAITANLGTRVAPRKSRLTALHYAYLQTSDAVLVETAPNAEAGNVRIARPGFGETVPVDRRSNVQPQSSRL